MINSINIQKNQDLLGRNHVHKNNNHPPVPKATDLPKQNSDSTKVDSFSSTLTDKISQTPVIDTAESKNSSIFSSVTSFFFSSFTEIKTYVSEKTDCLCNHFDKLSSDLKMDKNEPMALELDYTGQLKITGSEPYQTDFANYFKANPSVEEDFKEADVLGMLMQAMEKSQELFEKFQMNAEDMLKEYDARRGNNKGQFGIHRRNGTFRAEIKMEAKISINYEVNPLQIDLMNQAEEKKIA
jgi:hypothetical protein